MKYNELVTGTRFEIEILSRSGETTGHTYISQLLEPPSGKRMLISAPISGAKLVFIPVNSKIQIVFLNKKYGPAGFTAEVISKEYRGNVAVMLVEADSRLHNMQRRNFYRLDCNIDVEYCIHKGPSTNQTTEEDCKKAVTKNISGSGICIVTADNIPPKTTLKTAFSMSGTNKIEALGNVIRNVPVEVKQSKLYEIGLQFTKINSRDRDKIIKYIFEQQRVYLKKDVLDK